MGKKLNLSHLTESECEQILEVLQKDFEVQKAAKQRVNTVHDELVKEQQRVALLQSNPKFNETSCVICLTRFGLFTHRRRKCSKCNLNVCTACVGQYEDPTGNTKASTYICHVCSKDKAYRLLTNEWFRGSGKFNSKNYGSSKIARSLFKKASSSLSDTEMDSGYQPSSIRSLPGSSLRPRLDQMFDIDISKEEGGGGSLRGDGGGGGGGTEEDDTSFLTLHEEKEDGDDEGSDSSFDDELSPRSTTSSFTAAAPAPRPITKATSLDKLFFASRDAAFSLPPRPVPGESTPLGSRSRHNSVSGSGEFSNSNQLSAQKKAGSLTGLATAASAAADGQTTPSLEQSYEKRAPTPEFTRSLGRSRPRTLEEFRPTSRRVGDASGLYKEALDGARRSEEFKFRVKFDQLLIDLHLAVDEKSPNGLSNSFASPSYGEVMLLFRDRVKELLKGFSKRLQLAYDSFSNIDDPELTLQNVKADISHFVEELIGESLELTSDEAVSDLSSVSGDSPHTEQTLFEELLAQAIISKLLENHRREVSKSLDKPDGAVEEKLTGSAGTSNFTISVSSSGSGAGGIRRYGNHNNSQDSLDGDLSSGSNKFRKTKRHRKDSIESLFSNKSELIPNYDSDEKDEDDDDDNNDDVVSKAKDEDDNGSESGDKTLVGGEIGTGGDDDLNEQSSEIIKDFEELRELVKNTQGRPKVEAVVVEEVVEKEEVQEEQISQTTVDRDEAKKEVDSRFSVLDKVFNPEPSLPDFSEFENIDFNSDELDPDLLSMNLAIIPEETEEELELDEDENDEDEKERSWRGNWIFKGINGEPLPPKKKPTTANTDRPFLMMVPDPEHNINVRIGNKDSDQLSDFSDSDLFASDEEVSDEEESSFYPNTSKELARISHPRKNRHRGGKGKKSSLFRKNGADEDDEEKDETKGSHDEGEDFPDDPGPIIEVPKQELKLLTDLVPAENDDPRFVLAPESVTVMEGEPVKFTCSVEGTSPIDVFWYREGTEVEELDDSEDVELSSDGDKHTAVLYNVGHSMAGQYMCIALSETGKAIQYLVVTVKDNKQELKAPEFLKSISDVEITEGQSVKFRVKVKGFPPPRISWYKDGSLLRSSKGCRIEKFGNRDYILTIDYATMDDDAEYTVSARNVAGEIRSTAQVLVEPQSDLPARKQKQLSDSDSDNKFNNSKNNNNNNAITSTFASSSSTSSLFSSPFSSSPSLRTRQEAQQVNQLDRRMDMTQKAIDEEATKMEKDAAKDSPRLMSTIDLELLHTAEEVMQREKSDAAAMTQSKDRNLNTAAKPNQNGSDKDGTLLDLDLPESLEKHPPLPPKSSFTTRTKQPSSSPSYNPDDFSRGSRRKRAPEKFTSEVSFSSSFSTSLSFTDPDVNPSNISAAVDEILSQTSTDHAQSAPGVAAPSKTGDQQNNSSFESEKDQPLLDNSANSVSSGSAAASAASANLPEPDLDEELLDPVTRHEKYKEFHARDFEIHKKPEKKKWSVNLQPFSPRAEIVNKSLDEDDEKESSMLGIQIPADFSPDSSQHSSRCDDNDNNSGQSSPRQSVDSGVYVTTTRRQQQKEEKPEPVRMFGHTSEADVPESRTEFNTDEGSFDVPSVNRLKAMFSGSSSPSSSSPSSSSSPRSSSSSFSKPGDSKLIPNSISARSLTRHQQEKFSPVTATTIATAPTIANTTSSSISSISISSPSSSSPLLQSSSSTVLQQPPSSDVIQPSRSSIVLQLSPSPASSSSVSSSLSSSSPQSSLSSKTAEADKNIDYSNDKNDVDNDNKNDNNNNNNNNNNNSNNDRTESVKPDIADNSYWARKQRQREAKSKQNRHSLPPDMFFEFDQGKEPVLIYPEPNSNSNSNPKVLSPSFVEGTEEEQKPLYHQQQDADTTPAAQLSQNVETEDVITPSQHAMIHQSFEELQDFESPKMKSTQPIAAPRSALQPKLVVKQATIEDGSSDVSTATAGGSVPRIKSGCISARAAFWERRMMEGPADVDSDEFPEMVEAASASASEHEQESET